MDSYRLAVRALLVDGGKAYLIEEEISDGGSRWWLPGGGIDSGETFDEALHRELREELGVEEVDVESEPVGTFVWECTGGETGVSIVLRTDFDPPSSLDETEDAIRGHEWVDITSLESSRVPDWLSQFFEQYVQEGDG